MKPRQKLCGLVINNNGNYFDNQPTYVRSFQLKL